MQNRYIELWTPLIGEKPARLRQRKDYLRILSSVVVFPVSVVLGILGHHLRIIALEISCWIGIGTAVTVTVIAITVVDKRYKEALVEYFSDPIVGKHPPPSREANFAKWRSKYLGS
jgi:hypothetical protein